MTEKLIYQPTDDVLEVNTKMHHDLEPAVDNLLERHLSKAKEWFPHQVVPYSRGRDYDPEHEWTPEDFDGEPLDEAVRSALLVNLLTEDNLPYYFRTIERMFGDKESWGTWSRRWTAEEGRHSMAIYSYLMVTRAIDSKALERARMVQVSTGKVPEPPTLADGIAYITLQELATRVAHWNTGKMVGDPAAYEVMKRVAGDENLHHLFYRDLGSIALEIFPETFVPAVERQVADFEMPGTGIPDFKEHAKRINQAGIYNDRIHYEEVLKPVLLTHWKILDTPGLTGEAAEAQDRLGDRMSKIERILTKLETRRRNKELVVSA